MQQTLKTIVLSCIFLMALGFGYRAELYGQQATASINGIVRDASGAVIPGATVRLTNVQTGAQRVTQTNGTGTYVLLDILPGRYNLEVSKTGFVTASQSEFTLDVGQATTFDFVLKVGSVAQTIAVHATGALLQTSTSTLGTTISTTPMNDLPLNGRNFTELLTLTPGVSPVSTGQNAGGGGGFVGNPIGTYTFPSVNGQSNRSNFFLLDGLNDEGGFLDTYGVAPIVDQIQEFKVESHYDQASAGQALGSVVNVITKAGTNQFHGDAWEFVRNNSFDARNTFLPTVVPFKQNQFGGTLGGPVILPGYNGRNKTWFFAAYEGFRNHTTSTSLYNTVTPAELNGDFSAVPAQIYNPFSTTPDPAHLGEFLRQPFRNNQIPVGLLNPDMVAYAKAVFPAPMVTGIAGINGVDTTPDITRQDTASLRFDQQFNDRNSLWIRYTGFTQPDLASGGFPGILSTIYLHGYQAGASYLHSFGSTAVLNAQFGRTSVDDNDLVEPHDVPASLWQSVGFAPNFAGNFVGNISSFNPGMEIPGYLSFGSQLQEHQVTNVYEGKASLAVIRGRHTLEMGVSFQTNDENGPLDYLWDNFSSFNTANPESPSGTGDAMASYLLGVPSAADRRNTLIREYGGWVDGFYVHDQWKATDRLTVNAGLRYDFTLMPIFASGHGQDSGDLDLQNGTYIIAAPAPACGNGVGAPCIPGGSLPAHVFVTPLGNNQIIHNTFDNWQPRLGLAYRLRRRTVLRASAGRFFDNWAGTIQTAQNYSGTWPAIGQLLANNLNNPLPGSPTPTATALDPFHLGTAPPLPAPTPFNQVEWYMNPYIQDPYSWQWNFGLQQQLGSNTVLSAAYVGSVSDRLDLGNYNNVAVTPGPGNPQARAPYPYISPTYYDNSIGRSNYNAFQFSLNKKTSEGLTYLISYTWSKTEDIGCDGWYGVEGCSVQNPYNLNAEKSVAGFDLPNIFSGSVVYDLPLGKGARYHSGNSILDNIAGGWELNGIVTLTSGRPYNVNASGDIANTGNTTERANLIGNPTLLHPTPAEWFNTAAFAEPAPFTFGNLPRNALRSDWFKNVDLSIFREFPITESKKLEFRAEFFNAFNSVVWGVPDSTLTDPTFGRVLGIANTPRQVQFALKFYF
jgi:hypothetical protein